MLTQHFHTYNMKQKENYRKIQQTHKKEHPEGHKYTGNYMYKIKMWCSCRKPFLLICKKK